MTTLAKAITDTNRDDIECLIVGCVVKGRSKSATLDRVASALGLQSWDCMCDDDTRFVFVEYEYAKQVYGL